jgi:hypothetical protein
MSSFYFDTCLNMYHNTEGVITMSTTTKVTTNAEQDSTVELVVKSPDTPQEQSSPIAAAKDILQLFADELRSIGVAGELDRYLLLLLAFYTRFLDRLVSICLKGESASGKSHTVETVLKYQPPEAFVSLSGMSPKALVRWDADLRHKFLVIGELSGLQSETGNPWLRMLLSEGRLEYAVALPTEGKGWETHVIKKEGPTGVILTTTNFKIHPEDESRMISVSIDDSPEAIGATLTAQAESIGLGKFKKPDPQPWLDHQRFIAAGPTEVVIPFAVELARLIRGMSARTRRDLPQVLLLIKAHALLHRATRETDEQGKIVATLADYAAVYRLIERNLAEGQIRSVPENVRHLVEAVVSVTDHRPEFAQGCPQYVLAEKLGVDPSNISRQTAYALQNSFLVDNRERQGRPSILVLGVPLPRDGKVLPTPEELAGAVEKGKTSPEAA